jgi:hypothetical protein
MRSACILLMICLLPSPAKPDDGAASIAAGGIVLMKREPRIVMAKEVLAISESRVAVDYDFRNDADSDITTEVAFPIPAYGFGGDERDPTKQGFDDFKLWVGGSPAQFLTEVRATIRGHDVTTLLHSFHIDVATFGHYSERTESSADLDRLTPTQRDHLLALKIVELEGKFLVPLWMVQKKYHWTQSFPAHSTVHIRHEYTPWLGSSNSVESEWLRTGKNAMPDEELPSVCPTPSLLSLLRRGSSTNKRAYAIAYVDFILTTANTWKQPIEDFTLKVRRDRRTDLVSFCWNGSVNRVDADDFLAETRNFVPSKELRIGFLRGYTFE